MGENFLVGLHKNLQTFDLELESLTVKKNQLDNIIEISKCWAFPMRKVTTGKQTYWVRDGEVKWSGWDGPTSFLVPNPDNDPYTPRQEEPDVSPYLQFTY
jgi:hypothetical protein